MGGKADERLRWKEPFQSPSHDRSGARIGKLSCFARSRPGHVSMEGTNPARPGRHRANTKLRPSRSARKPRHPWQAARAKRLRGPSSLGRCRSLGPGQDRSGTSRASRRTEREKRAINERRPSRAVHVAFR